MFNQKIGFTFKDIDLIEFKIINFKNNKPLSYYIQSNIESKRKSAFLNRSLYNFEKKEYNLILEAKGIDSEVHDLISESKKNIGKLTSLESRKYFRALIYNYKDKFNQAFQLYVSELSVFINYAKKIKSKIEDNNLHIKQLLDAQKTLKTSERNYLSSTFAISVSDRQKFVLKSKYIQDSINHKNIDNSLDSNKKLEIKFAKRLESDEKDIDRKIKILDSFQKSLLRIKDAYSDKLGLRLTNQINDLSYQIEDLKVSIIDRDSVDLRMVDFKNKFYDFEISFSSLVQRTKSLGISNAKTIEILTLYGKIFPYKKKLVDKSLDDLNSLVTDNFEDYARNLEQSLKVGFEVI